MPLKRVLGAGVMLLFLCFPSLSQTTETVGSAEELVRVALQRNQAYLAAHERVKEAEAAVRQAGLRPTPTIEIETATGAILGSRGESEYSAGYFQTIETGAKRTKRVEIAQKGVLLAEAEARERLRDLTFEVKSRYIAAAVEGAKLATLRSIQPLTEESYRLTASRVELGDAAPLEQQLLLAEKNNIEARQTLLVAARQAALLELKAAVGMTRADALDVVPDFRAAERTLDLAQLQESALQQRGDLRILSLLEDQALLEGDLARAEGRPNLTASARYTRTHSSFDQSGLSASGALVPLRDAENVITFGISIPLFTRNRTLPSVDTAQSRQIQQKLRREQLARAIPQEVEAAYRRWTGAMQSIKILRDGVIEPTQKNLTIIREAYRLGELRLLDVLNEQRRLLDLQLSFVEAQAEEARALAELERTVGGILP